MLHGPSPPHHIGVPSMRHRWETLTFLHWDYPPQAVQRLLPDGLQVETWDGRAWVALVPFRMRVRPPVGPRGPEIAVFPETNVRTYVIGPDGTPGVWFFSLDAAHAPAVAAARAGLGLPYHLSSMTITETTADVTYRSRRRLPGSRRPAHDMAIAPGDLLAPSETGPFERYLTARFTLWARHGPLLLRVPAEHPPWPLRWAGVVRLEQDLVQAAGLAPPRGDPISHFAEGVDVRIGFPKVVEGSR